MGWPESLLASLTGYRQLLLLLLLLEGVRALEHTLSARAVEAHGSRGLKKTYLLLRILSAQLRDCRNLSHFSKLYYFCLRHLRQPSTSSTSSSSSSFSSSSSLAPSYSSSSSTILNPTTSQDSPA